MNGAKFQYLNIVYIGNNNVQNIKYALSFQTDVDDCFPNPCQNRGACVDQVDAYNCTCEQGFVGKDCETSK